MDLSKIEDLWLIHSYQYAMIRISNTLYNLDQLFALFDEDKFPVMVIGREVSSREHFHLVVGMPVDDCDLLTVSQGKGLRKLREWMNKQGYKGNSDFSTALVRDINQLLKYTIKDGEYLYRGISVELMNRLVTRSFKKFDKKAYANELNVIKDKYVTDKLVSKRAFLKEVLDLRLKYDMSTKANIIADCVRNCIITKDAQAKEQYLEVIFNHIFPNEF